MKKNIGLILCLLLLCCCVFFVACGEEQGSETDTPTQAATDITETEIPTQALTDMTETDPQTSTEATPETQAPITEESTTEGETTVTKAPITPIAFEEIKTVENLEAFIAEVDYENGEHNNEAKEVGAILSPYFTMKINGTDVACYAVRTAIGAHSFAMIDASEASFPLEIDLGVLTDYRKVTVLPEHYGIKAENTEGGATATVDRCGNYTFVLNGDKTKAIKPLLAYSSQSICKSS